MRSLLVRSLFTRINGLPTCFFIGFAVRMIPDLLALQHPVGFDIINYAALMKSGAIWPHWTALFATSWLLPAILVSLYNVLRVDPFMLLKVLSPLFFGLNVAGVFWLARKMLNWGNRTSILAGLFFAVQLASLRISWDLLRNTLGLGILLFTLPLIKNLNSVKRGGCFVLFSLLSVFAHEYAAVTLFTTVFGTILWSKIHEKGLANCKGLLLATLPSLTVFLVGIYLRLFPISYRVETNILETGDAVNANVCGLFFLVDYFKIKNLVDHYGSYFELFISVVTLFCLLYLPYLFLILRGFFIDNVLNVWTALLLFGSFGCLIVPFCALEYWHRWMFMLVYPFTLYAVNGMKNYRNSCAGLRYANKAALSMICVTFLLGCFYLATPVLMSTVNVGLFSINPVNKYFSFAPTVPYQDVDSIARAMTWLNRNLGEDDCLLAHHAFLCWSKFYLSKSHTLIHFENNVHIALDTAHTLGFRRIYFIWWNKAIEWYGLTVPEGFYRVQDFDRISIYEFVNHGNLNEDF